MGASGVQMATRFVATYECDASDEFKKAYVDCNQEAIMIINSPVGLPGRVIKSPFINDISTGKKKPFHCPYHCITTCKCQESPFCIALALGNAKQGRLDKGFAFCGANAYRVNEIVSVKQLMCSLAAEYETASKQASGELVV